MSEILGRLNDVQRDNQLYRFSEEFIPMKSFPRLQLMERSTKAAYLSPGPKQYPDQRAHVIWEGDTWDSFPVCCLCLAPLCCRKREWFVTTKKIELIEGCCRARESKINIRHITDIGYKSQCCCRVCCGRGTVVIGSDNNNHPILEISMCCNDISSRELYRRIRDAWTFEKIGNAVTVDTD
eukprot:TRINITY_DN6201_c0_g1_i1.p2 TRINITY_DN6201_c0_g1~~TRINITY_DN6201_c0_g1_i1.p2  ORF type:complete len:181 (-),score=7.49 TRINITY_DN6201_c0_g1_i1:457-999(-)